MIHSPRRQHPTSKFKPAFLVTLRVLALHFAQGGSIEDDLVQTALELLSTLHNKATAAQPVK